MDGTATQMRWGQKHAFAKNNLRPIMYYAKCPNACSVASRFGCYSYYAILSLGHVVHTAGLHEYSPVLFFGVMNRRPVKLTCRMRSVERVSTTVRRSMLEGNDGADVPLPLSPPRSAKAGGFTLPTPAPSL